ncbi:glycosyltransferase [Pseudomonas moraviensis]|uniref:glycosyltransferase n=1 Tax=Pseudomonas moraviensis TaxID=321662 RepID=UPI002493AFBD|nr:glycosyltransferase [Pseudomonas moraviensis]GLH38154.1 glycosyl transferase family 1 [Pseudomonas moraviensis]
MKLVIFTPGVKSSAIGRMTRLVVRALLAQKHHVVLVRTESQHVLSREPHDFGCTLLQWTDEAQVAHEIATADSLIYQIGDNYEFHEGGVTWLQKAPGIVCLHDFFLGHLFWGWSQERRDQAHSVLTRWYGEQVAADYFNVSDSAAFIRSTREAAPLTEWISSLATGVMTHSYWGCDRVMAACAGPVFVTPLAYDAPGAITATGQSSGGKKLKVLTIGHVNPNKRVESCIKAIASDPLLRKNLSYRLVGAVAPEVAQQLTELAASSGVELVISNEVDDATLSQAIREADVISCLRWPSLEAASASAIEAMLYGKATIVTDTGFYKELPDQYVRKVSPDQEMEDLKQIFLSLHNDRASTVDIGKNAQAWAKETFTAENYAHRLEQAIPVVRRAQVIISAVDHFAHIIDRWSANPELLTTQDITKPLSIFNTNTIV